MCFSLTLLCLTPSSYRHLSQNPPSYNDVSSTYYPFVSLEIASPQASEYAYFSINDLFLPWSSGSHQTNPPLLQHQHRTKAKRLRLKKAEMIEEVKQYIIKSLCMSLELRSAEMNNMLQAAQAQGLASSKTSIPYHGHHWSKTSKSGGSR